MDPKQPSPWFSLGHALARILRLWPPRRGIECPCCGGRFRRFEPFGVKVRENALCPGCGALERHRLQWLYLRERTNIRTARLRLLHFAPEPYLQKLLRALPNLEYVSADLRSPRADLLTDILALPFAVDCFDVLLCSHVLEHIPDDRAAMRELLRVMKPGGWAVIQVPIRPGRETTFEDWSVTSAADRERVFGQGDHVRIYGTDYYDRLREAGFEVDLVRLPVELGRESTRRFGLRTRQVICVVRKSGLPGV